MNNEAREEKTDTIEDAVSGCGSDVWRHPKQHEVRVYSSDSEFISIEVDKDGDIVVSRGDKKASRNDETEVLSAIEDAGMEVLGGKVWGS